MKSKIPRSYVFSDQAFNFLKESGFHLVIEESLQSGCRRAFLPLVDVNHLPTGLEFIEILDEDLFANSSLAPHPKVGDPLHIDPTIVEGQVTLDPGFKSHPNGVFQLTEMISSSAVKNEPWRDLLNLTKRPGLMAVVLRCENFELAKSFNRFQRIFNYNSSSYGLIHLGPSSFDLLISSQ